MLSLGQFLGLGPIKSIQAGVAASAGTFSITAVNPDKCEINSWSKGSAGYAAARGNISLTPLSNYSPMYRASGTAPGNGSWPDYEGGITGGATDLTVGVYSAWLVDEDTVETDGPCRWEVTEYRGVI